MQSYIALTLLYDRRLTRIDPETGELVEQGYVQVGETIALEDDRAAILLELGYIAEVDQIADTFTTSVSPPDHTPDEPSV